MLALKEKEAWEPEYSAEPDETAHRSGRISTDLVRELKPYFSPEKEKQKPWIEQWSASLVRARKSPTIVLSYTNQRSFREELTHINEAILSSRWILDLRDNWDDHGSSSYGIQVWNRMVNFLMSHARETLECYSIDIPSPEILPGPKGSIDLLWKTNSYEMLVNIPSDPSELAGFYGDDKGNISIKGKIDTSKTNQGLLVWLMTHQYK